MIQFIKAIIIFAAFPILYFGFNTILNVYYYSHPRAEHRRTNILIMGDSHLQKALDPALFHSAQNIAQTAEPYVLTFWKLKSVIDIYNPDTVILGFSPHNISAFNDLKFSNKTWASEMFKRCYPIEELSSISGEIPVDYGEFYRTLWKQIALYPKKDHINYIGHYQNSYSSHMADEMVAIRTHFYLNDSLLGVSEVSISYLDSIIELCAANHIAIVLANSPVHERYESNIPNAIHERYESVKHKYEEQLLIIDGANDLYADSLYLDADHLNGYGAMKFTTEVMELVRTTKKAGTQ